MPRYAYLLFESAALSGKALRERLLGDVANQLRSEGARKLAVRINDEAVADAEAVRIRRSEPPVCALLAFDADSERRETWEPPLAAVAARLAGYAVEASVPKAEAPARDASGRTPGVCMVTCIRHREDLTAEAFLERWLVDHEAVALETQSTHSYVRNRILRALTPDAPDWDGIVEEGFPLAALREPKVWYAAGDSDEVLDRNRRRMIESCRRFLDFGALESTPMSEYTLPD